MNFIFENLTVWKDSVNFSSDIYKLTKAFPYSEIYGLTSQLKRASVSISLNIAEGKGRYSKKEFVHFLYLARGSLYEVVACIEIALSQNFIKYNEYETIKNFAAKIQAKLNALINSLK